MDTCFSTVMREKELRGAGVRPRGTTPEQTKQVIFYLFHVWMSGSYERKGVKTDVSADKGVYFFEAKGII